MSAPPAIRSRPSSSKAARHALAWVSMKAMPTTHWLPMAMTEGMKGCGGCHRLGLKSEEEIRGVEGGWRDVRARLLRCLPHPATSFPSRKLGSRRHAAPATWASIIRNGRCTPHPSMAFGTCSSRPERCRRRRRRPPARPVTCLRETTAYGPPGASWAVRLPLPEDPQWAADRTTILQALGVLDPQGNPAARLDAVKQADVARLTQEEWQAERDRMIEVCEQCHSANLVRGGAQEGRRDDPGDGPVAGRGDSHRRRPLPGRGAAQAGSLRLRLPGLAGFPRRAHGDRAADSSRCTWNTGCGPFRVCSTTIPTTRSGLGWSEMLQDLTEIRALAAELRKRR